MHMTRPWSESPTSCTAYAGLDALSQQGLKASLSRMFTPAMSCTCLSPLASAHLQVSAHTLPPPRKSLLSAGQWHAQLCPRAVPAPCGLHLVACNLHARAMFYLDLYSQSLAHHGYLNILAELVGVTPEFPKQPWNCFLETQLCPSLSKPLTLTTDLLKRSSSMVIWNFTDVSLC